MPMFGGKHFSNPKVGMRHGTASGDTSASDDMSGTMNEPQNETEVQPQEKGVTITENPMGGMHVHVHHTDEHADHPDAQSALGHASMAMGGDEEQGESPEMQYTEDESSEPEHKMTPYKAKRADSGGM